MPVNKTPKEVVESIGSWHQFVRSLSLETSVAFGHSVTVPLRRDHCADPQKRLQDDCLALATDQIIETEFDIPNASSLIHIDSLSGCGRFCKLLCYIPVKQQTIRQVIHFNI